MVFKSKATKESKLDALRSNPSRHKVKRFMSYDVHVDPRDSYTACRVTCKVTGETINKTYQHTPTKAKQAFIRDYQYLTL